MADATTLLFELVSWITDILTLVIAAIFMYNFAKRRTKPYGVYMVFILNIMDCVFPLMDIFSKVVTQNKANAIVFGAIKASVYHFGIAWTTAIAIYSFLILYSNRILNTRRFLVFALSCCFVIAVFFALLVGLQISDISASFDKAGLVSVNYSPSILTSRISYVIFEDLVGTLIPILITFYCYYRVYRALDAVAGSVINPARVLYYSIIQMVCFLPGIICDVIFILQGVPYNLPCALIVGILHRCWGFLNLLAYGLTNPADEEDKEVEKAKPEDPEADSTRSRTETSLSVSLATHLQ